jgi:hypothetical protein
VYAGTGQGVFKTTNGGQAWSAANTGLASLSIRAVAVDPAAPATVYAGSTEGVFKSGDAGGSWVPVNSGLGETDIRALAMSPAGGNTLYAGTRGGGVFRSTDGASSWTALNSGLVNRDVRAIALAPSGECIHAGTFGGGVFDFATVLAPCSALQPAVVASVLPSSRSVTVGTTATVFATIINPNAVTARACGIVLVTDVEATFGFQTTDPATNQLTGTLDTPVDIAPGDLQTFVIAVTPQETFSQRELVFGFSCSNAATATTIVGVNTLLMVSSGGAVPDMVALAAADAGVVRLTGPGRAGAFAVATVNVGVDGNIVASADTGTTPLPVSVLICETDPATSVCLEPAAPATEARGIDAGETPTFAIFVTASAAIDFDPAVNRIFVRFRSTTGTPRGSTSVAVRTE